MIDVNCLIPSHLIWEARKRIYQVVQRTPLIKSHYLSSLVNGNVYLKLENTHPISAFKIRGAANKILGLPFDEQQKGVTTFSTGNHGLAVAYIAKQLGMKAVICMSPRVPKAKIDRINELGAKIEIYGKSQDDAKVRCEQLRDEEGLTIIPPFDDKAIICGQATIGTELIEDLPTIDTAIVPLSGGGLLAGIGLALKSYNNAIDIVGTSMERGAVMHESLKAGKPIELEEEETLADSLLGGIGLSNQYTFPLVRAMIDQTELVSEEAILNAMGLLIDKHRLIVEGAAATGVAALLKEKQKYEKKNVVIIISGSNVDITVVYDVMKAYLNQNRMV
ncbi:hydroxyectoine utilization dehydratase EutB [Halalkalibacterium ligniniphilum]|uniref:hydroxyectoine utilization dehydratase EutB n=1 Tax=Halalkalibacterium ligniniphilum TaxID=1134413 RepID=UPI00034CB5E1|nr:hydroxyectoine utilization dehydratase EutB [Halalkalibacterium ligniniphilum]